MLIDAFETNNSWFIDYCIIKKIWQAIKENSAAHRLRNTALGGGEGYIKCDVNFFAFKNSNFNAFEI